MELEDLTLFKLVKKNGEWYILEEGFIRTGFTNKNKAKEKLKSYLDEVKPSVAYVYDRKGVRVIREFYNPKYLKEEIRRVGNA